MSTIKVYRHKCPSCGLWGHVSCTNYVRTIDLCPVCNPISVYARHGWAYADPFIAMVKQLQKEQADE